MKVTLKLFAMLSSYLPEGARGHEAEMNLPRGTTVAAAIERLALPAKLTHLVLVNGVYIAPGERTRHALNAGDVLAIWPPVAGG